MKRIIYSLALMLMATMPLAAQQVEDEALGDSLELNPESSYGDTGESRNSSKRKLPNLDPPVKGALNYHEYTFTYQSVDANKNPITLSAKVYFDSYWCGVSKVLLNCHPTVTSNSEVPTGATPVDGDIKRMCGDTGCWMVVCPDYCGYGVSSYTQHPYLIHDVTARNCVDAVAEAIRLVRAGKWSAAKTIPIPIVEDIVDGMLSKDERYYLEHNYSTDIVGYSQGAATALACTKYLESDACPQDVKNLINFRQTTCGDGPYSIRATLDQYLKWGRGEDTDDGVERDLEYPCVLPLILAAAKEAYQDGCMKTVEVEDFFAPEFLEKTNIMTMLRSKATTTSDLNSQVKRIWVDELGRRLRPVDIMSDKIIKSDGTYRTDTEQYKCLQRVMDWAELASGWNPQHRITFFHLKRDGVVPYSNYLAVKDGIQYKTTNGVYDLDADGKPIKNPFVNLIESAEEYSKYSGWRELMSDLLNCAPAEEDIELLNHADGGTLFYVIYLFKMQH